MRTGTHSKTNKLKIVISEGRIHLKLDFSLRWFMLSLSTVMAAIGYPKIVETISLLLIAMNN